MLCVLGVMQQAAPGWGSEAGAQRDQRSGMHAVTGQRGTVAARRQCLRGFASAAHKSMLPNDNCACKFPTDIRAWLPAGRHDMWGHSMQAVYKSA